MEDVPQGKVQVRPARLKKLKKIISDCDRKIQSLNYIIDRCNRILNAYVHPSTTRRLDEALKRKADLDEKRKTARLELKGYN